MIKYRYNVINKKGEEEPWTGTFKSSEEAQKWYKLHGKFHEDRGHELKLDVSDDTDMDEDE